MVISKTPFRISFFGGGTDYPVWYREHGGAILGTTINKYCYISCRNLPPFFDHKYRILYSKIENVKRIEDIEHPSVRDCIKFLNIQDGLEIHHDADLPARSGLGSSSSFTVGMLHSLYALKGQIVSKMTLAKNAIYVEQEMIKENVGIQDQIHAAYGGFNLIKFDQTGNINVTPLTINQEKVKGLNNNLVLFFTGFSRFASEIAEEQIKETKNKQKELHTMHEMVNEAITVLNSSSDGIDDFGKLLHESWKLKRGLTSKISSNHIDQIYEAGINAGAIGGKLLGAGGGGFMLFYCNEDKKKQLLEKLNSLLYVPFNFENLGSQIVFYQPENLS